MALSIQELVVPSFDAAVREVPAKRLLHRQAVSYELQGLWSASQGNDEAARILRDAAGMLRARIACSVLAVEVE